MACPPASVVFVAVLLTVVTGQETPRVVNFTMDNTVAVVGSSVRFSCSVADRGFEIIRYGKMLDGQDEPVHFSENGKKDSSVNLPPRFNFTFKRGSPYENFFFDITDLKPEDSGNYSCFISEFRPYITKELFVQALPSSVQLIVDNNEVVDSTTPVKMIDEEKHTVKCVVKNSVPAAQIYFTLDGSPIPQNFIVDSPFVQYIKTTQTVDQSKPYLTKVMYETQSTIYVKMSSAETNRKIGCNATTFGPNMSAAWSMSKYFITKFEGHPPMFYCNDTLSAKLNAPFTFSCRVRATPAVSSSALTIHYGSATQEVVPLRNTTAKSKDNTHSATGTQSKADPEEHNIVVSITTVTTACFGKYMLSATNSLGTTERVITLGELRSNMGGPNSAVERRMSVFGVLAGVLLAVHSGFMSSRRL